MGQDRSDRAERPGPAPEPFDDFYLREYPAKLADEHAASHRRDLVSTTHPQASVPASTAPTRTRVPEECLDAAELADEVISRPNRNQRDAALAAALTDYSVASQACRREATR
jgi:hypothetical protein